MKMEMSTQTGWKTTILAKAPNLTDRICSGVVLTFAKFDHKFSSSGHECLTRYCRAENVVQRLSCSGDVSRLKSEINGCFHKF